MQIFKKWRAYQTAPQPSGTANSGLHPAVLRQRAGLSRLLIGHGHHHLCHDNVLLREERAQLHVHLDPVEFLVHHRHHDNFRVSQ